jgi:aryl-alcohol dehydrogenase-like predicted oxidoreductase
MEPALVQAAIDAGMNFLDTGRSYFRGQNEIMVGKVISGIRKDVVIQSKLRVRFRDEGERSSAEVLKETLDSMKASLEASLKALGTDYIDIMLIHGASSAEVAYHDAVLKFFSDLKEKGIIRAHGFSSHTNQVDMLKAANQNPFYDVIMVPYNHKGSYIHSNSGNYSEWDQPALEIEMDKAKKHDIGLIAMKTCSGGPYAPEGDAQPSFDKALRWILSQNRVQTMAVAMGNFQQIEENLKALA